MSRRNLFYTDTSFDKLPKGVPKERLHAIMLEFKSGNLVHRDEFILAYTRLVTTVALYYGYNYHCGDELMDVAHIELCKYPQRVADGFLKDERIIAYLINRIHTVCKDCARVNSSLPVPHSSIIRRGKTQTKRLTLPKDEDITDSNNGHFTVEPADTDFINDLRSCVRTERERIVLDMTLAGYRDVEIGKAFGGRGSSTIKVIKTELFGRYRLRDLNQLQTFLPFPDYEQSAQCLDDKRLCEQRFTCEKILLGKVRELPVSKMWSGYEYSLCSYAIEICAEWLDRGHRDKHLEWFAKRRKQYTDTGHPLWLGDVRLHKSHQSRLLRLNKSFYSKYNWCVAPQLPYHWPVN